MLITVYLFPDRRRAHCPRCGRRRNWHLNRDRAVAWLPWRRRACPSATLDKSAVFSCSADYTRDGPQDAIDICRCVDVVMRGCVDVTSSPHPHIAASPHRRIPTSPHPYITTSDVSTSLSRTLPVEHHRREGLGFAQIDEIE